MRRRGIEPVIAVANDYRDYSLSIKNAPMPGLVQAGIHARDIGPAVSPVAYFAQFHLNAPAVAIVTASHNPNGWTGVKMGFERPLTHGPDEMGVIVARDLSAIYPNATFVANVKSTGLFAADPVLKANGAKVDYWKTGHSHMKRRVHTVGALAGFEKSGHYFLAEPIGRGYDCGMRVAIEICKLMDRNPDMSMSGLRRALPLTYSMPTVSPYAANEEKYNILARLVTKLENLTELRPDIPSTALPSRGHRVVNR